MKKTLLILPIILAACAGTTGAGNGLSRFDIEPKNCEYLYTMNSTVTTYNESDAYDYIEKDIIAQNKTGDSYYIANANIIENDDAIFGLKNTFKFKVKVYNCTK